MPRLGFSGNGAKKSDLFNRLNTLRLGGEKSYEEETNLFQEPQHLIANCDRYVIILSYPDYHGCGRPSAIVPAGTSTHYRMLHM